MLYVKYSPALGISEKASLLYLQTNVTISGTLMGGEWVNGGLPFDFTLLYLFHDVFDLVLLAV